MRHAAIHHGAQKRAEQPARPRESVPRETRRGLERRAVAVAHVVLAVGHHRHVDRQDQRLETGALRALDERRDDFGRAREIRLEPRGAPDFGDLLEPRQRSAALYHRDVQVGCGTREHRVALVGRERSPAHRRKSERQVVGAPEDRRLLRAAARAHQDARNEVELVERRAVAAQRSVRFRSARDVTEDRARKNFARRFLEVLERKKAPQCARRRFLRGGPCGDDARRLRLVLRDGLGQLLSGRIHVLRGVSCGTVGGKLMRRCHFRGDRRFSPEPANTEGPLVLLPQPYLARTMSGSHVAIPGNTVISAMHSTIMKKNGIDAYAT